MKQTIYYSMSTPPEKENLTEYRLNKLETTLNDLVNNLSILRDIVLKWDARIGEGHWPLKWSTHAEKIEDLSKRQEKTDKQLDDMKKFMYKAYGALIVISIIIQLFGPILVERTFGRSQSTIQLIEK